MKLVSIDLDGVLNTYSGQKDYDKDKICPIRPGAYDFLKKLHENYEIEIFTVRDKHIVEKWLKDSKISQFIKQVTDKKNPYSSVILDDRALNFHGDFLQAYFDITTFEPYWKI